MWLSLDEIFLFFYIFINFENYTEGTAYLNQIWQYRQDFCILFLILML